MAEDFPPNLDDGELWLPSDIISDVGVHRHQGSTAFPSCYPSDLAHIEELAHQLAAFGLLDRNRSISAVKQPPDLSLHPEGTRPLTRFGPAKTGFVYNGVRAPVGRSVSSVGTGAFLPGSMTVHQFNTGKSVPSQLNGFGQGKARVLQRQQSQGPARFCPVPVSGSGRECGGTGVFLPRVINNDVRKKSNMKGTELQKQPIRYTVAGKQGMPSIQPPPEITLPQDWTY